MCIDTLINTYINLKEGLALLGLVLRYMQCSYEKRKKKTQTMALLNCSHGGIESPYHERSNLSI